MIRCTDEATLNGATPMFSRRVSVEGASLVCSVESTRCPVCEALTAMSAVSRSRISPTMITSGSWRRNARSTVANVRFAFSLILTWLTPWRLISTGSSTLEMFRSEVFSTFNAEYSDTVFPLPVGPVTRIMPWGRWIASMYRSSWCASKPSRSRLMTPPAESRIRITTFSPCTVGKVLTRKSTARFFDSVIFIRPSCGTRRSAMSRRERIFTRATIRPIKVSGGEAMSCNTPSTRKRMRVFFS